MTFESDNLSSTEPLAYRMCPRTLEEFVGQEHILGDGKLLYRMIKADRISSIILYGPPGTGKTSLARIIANTTRSQFKKLNAVTSGIADIKKVAEETANPILNPNGRTVLFVDEIHRFNKSQQDALLPNVENGSLVLIGATTENPFFEVNKSLISRSSVFMLKPLGKDHIKAIVRAALADKERGLGNFLVEISDDAMEFIAEISSGDARIALNALELAVMTSESDSEGKVRIDLATMEDCVQKKSITFDKSGENHYDNISAFIKSMRGSDPDAAILYMARALYAGEDIEFLARRVLICASEDVGMANPTAMQVAASAFDAVRMVGAYEGRIILAHAVIMVATSPKSNSSIVAIDSALADVAAKNTGEVPMHLRNAVVSGMSDLGYGQGYKYAHSYEDNIADLEFMPDAMKGTVYYKPSKNGYEARIIEYLEKVKAVKNKEKKEK
jgi:putative ATPase